MNTTAWRIDDEDVNPDVTGASVPLLVTGRALRDALTRTWRIWVAAAILGGLLGAGVLAAVPHPASASTTLLMVHPERGDSAMTTDLNLLQTRTVAARVIRDLGLSDTPETFLKSFSVEAVNDQILAITVNGPTAPEAVDRARSLIVHFLDFRSEQLRSVSDGLISGYRDRVAELETESAALTREYERLSGSESDQVRANDVLSTRANVANEIARLQAATEDARLQTEAAITATHVIDAPARQSFGFRRQLALFVASGAIVCLGLAVGLILFRTLTTDRLRRRRDVAMALGVPTRVGVGAIPSQRLVGRTGAAVRSRIAALLRGHPVRWTDRRRRRNLEALVQGLESALPARFSNPAPARAGGGRRAAAARRTPPTALGLAAIDRAGTTALVLRTLAQRLVDRGYAVLLVDLSGAGALSGIPGTYRPDGDPALALGPRRGARRTAVDRDELGDLGVSWYEADVVLVLVEVEPGIDLDVVGTWVTRLVPLVTAGRASGELLRTIAGLVAKTGLEMPFALLEGADRSDQTLGHPTPRTEDRDEPQAVQAR